MIGLYIEKFRRSALLILPNPGLAILSDASRIQV